MTQEEALTILKTGANVFLTGEPGSGKSHTVNQYVAYLRSRGVEPAVTASTGIAATHIGGVTIHSWSGIGVRRSLSEEDLDQLCQNERLSKRVGGAHVLIIDEVSMLSAHTLSLADAACRALRRSSKPFGGLQVVLVGDFFQLPPIVSREDREAMQRIAQQRSAQGEIVFEGEDEGRNGTPSPRPGDGVPFAYRSRSWSDLNPIPCYLHEQHRQEDPRFLEVLSAIRAGSVSPEHRAMLNERLAVPNAKHEPRQDVPLLFSHNADVDRINDDRLSGITASGRIFLMRAHGAPAIIEHLKRTCLSPERLTLKIGAKVMFTKNNAEEGYVNGTTGEVCGFREDGAPLVTLRSGEVLAAEETDWEAEIDGRVAARVTQVPLRLAWAITVHKSQGMSLDAAQVDLSKAFEYGQGYVALSRVRTFDGLHLLGLNERALAVHPDTLAKDSEFRDLSEGAREAFTAMNPSELSTMHDNFIRACGGNVNAVAAGDVGEPLPRRSLRRGSQPKEPHWQETLTLLKTGKTIPEIAALRGRTEGTIFKHIEDLKDKGEIDLSDIAHLGEEQKEDIQKIHRAMAKAGTLTLTPLFEHFGGLYPYELLRLARLLYERGNE